MEQPLAVLITHGIRGDLDLLPRLYTFIRRLRADLPAESLSLLVDLGESCDNAVWHCQTTEGRSTVIVLDGMGYDAANVQNVLSETSRKKLVDQVFLALVDDEHPQVVKGVKLVTALPSSSVLSPMPDEGEQTHPYTVSVCLTPVEMLHLQEDVLYLPAVDKGQVGVVIMETDGTLRYAVHIMPPNTPPDATISGAVDFVLSEAQYYDKQYHERYNGRSDIH